MSQQIFAAKIILFPIVRNFCEFYFSEESLWKREKKFQNPTTLYRNHTASRQVFSRFLYLENLFYEEAYFIHIERYTICIKLLCTTNCNSGMAANLPRPDIANLHQRGLGKQ
jgi:hypothetical protein